MTSLLQNIRGALQEAAIGVIGFPPANQRAVEGVLFKPTIGTAWARLTLMNNSRRPFSLDGSDSITGGLFQIDLFYPVGKGTADIEVMADAVADAYPLADTLIKGVARVWINRAEPKALPAEPDWLHTAVTVSWTTAPN